ncbi:hypothetical protein [Streptomyces sp. NBC_00038]|uniref:hypothetical protein n=1 Tax=Streptomyces sp. NBC_00038 TaxID=2903615 RepID=UPI002252B643|nr:hypothetical protein [Streptomyces sp. NBC_00038]MCX5562026.1 hypothetical protein [Streptomyces sp. NBC_00038]
MRSLFETVAAPLGQETTQWAFLRSWHLLAIDGVQLECPDTAENTKEFGKTSHRGAPGPYPQARVVGLGECGTHAIIDARIGSCSGAKPNLREDRVLPHLPALLLRLTHPQRNSDRKLLAAAAPSPTDAIEHLRTEAISLTVDPTAQTLTADTARGERITIG